MEESKTMELQKEKTLSEAQKAELLGYESPELSAYDMMDEESKQKVDAITSAIDVTDSQAILQYGLRAQSNISNFSDNILNQVQSKDSGYTGEVLRDLMVNIKDMDVDGLNEKKGLFGFFGGMKKSTSKFIAKYEKVSVHIDRILSELDKNKMQLLKDITVLDKLYDTNLEYMRELEYFIVAGENKIEEMKEDIIPEMMKKAEASQNPVDAQALNDYQQLLNRFEKKIHDLKLSRMIAIQTGPQVRLIQNGDQVLVEKIQSSILNTIPLWKNQIVIAISLFRQEKALKLQREVSDTTNDLLSKNSEMLKQNTIEVAKESERGIVDIETLKKVNADLIETIEETIRIQQEGSEKRQQAELELKQMEKDLGDKLIQARD